MIIHVRARPRARDRHYFTPFEVIRASDRARSWLRGAVDSPAGGLLVVRFELQQYRGWTRLYLVDEFRLPLGAGFVKDVLEVRTRRIDRNAELARAFAQFGKDNPSHYRLLTLRSPGDRPPPSAERARDLMERPLVELESRGRLRGSDRDALLQTLWALLHGLISLPTSRPDYEWSEGLVDTAIDTFLNGVLQPAHPTQPRAQRGTSQ